MTCELIGTVVEIVIAQNGATSDNSIISREAEAGFLEKMIESLARDPAECITRMPVYYTLMTSEAADSVQIKLPLGELGQFGEVPSSDLADIRLARNRLWQVMISHIHTPIISI